MKRPQSLVLNALAAFLSLSNLQGAEPAKGWSEDFQTLGKEWKSNLGTWTAKEGVLRGFQSGKRNHGPSLNRRIDQRNFRLEWEFRMEGKAAFSGLGFNRSTKGHLLHLVTGRKGVKLIAHPGEGEETVYPIQDAQPLSANEWHHAVLEIRGPNFLLEINGRKLSAEHPCIAEVKGTLILGGGSGGPEGEAAGALEYRNLKFTPLP